MLVLYGNLHKRLADTRDELARVRESLRIADEQAAFQQGVSDEAETRAIVAGTPLADRERQQALQDLRRLRRHRDELRAQESALLAEQDELLDRLLAQPGGPRASRSAQ